MKNEFLNMSFRTFLVSFAWKSTDKKFICQGAGLIEVLKNFGTDSKGVEYIKEFDLYKNTFKRISKETILNQFSWDTENYLYLKSHSYFKK